MLLETIFGAQSCGLRNFENLILFGNSNVVGIL